MSGGKKTTTTSKQDTATQTTLPAWMTAAGQQTFNKASALVDQSKAAQPYQGELTAGMTGNQTAASNLAASSAGAWHPALAQAQGMTTAAGGAPAGHVDAAGFDGAAATKYMNPFISNVQGNTLNTMRGQDAQDLAGLADSAQAAGAYGGARDALLKSETMKNQALARTNYVDSSNAAAYDSARSQFNSDADRSLQGQTTNAGLYEQMLSRMMGGGAQMGQLADEGSALGARDISSLAATGGIEQDTKNAGDNAAYMEWQRQQKAPLDQYQQLMSILQGTPRDVSTTGTSNGTETSKQQGSFLDTLLALGQMGASAAASFSDPRLKYDVGLIERLANGLGVYRYRYLWQGLEEPENIGVMANEVARIAPAALGPIVHGFLTVNYSKLSEMFA